MKKQRNLLAAFALSAFFATLVACNGVSGLSGADGLGGERPVATADFTGDAIVTNEKRNTIRLTLDETDGLFSFRGTSGLTLNSGGAESFPANLDRTKKPNGIIGVSFMDGVSRTALITIDGWINASDTELTLSYNGAAGEIYLGEAKLNSFTLPVKNNVWADEVPEEPDVEAPAPEVTEAVVYDAAPKNVLVRFDRQVVIDSIENFSIEINGSVKAEVSSCSISGAGFMIVLKYGLVYGDSAVLSYTKGEGSRVISTEQKELEEFSIPIQNLVNERTNSIGDTQAPVVLAGLQVSLPRTNWHQYENLKPSLTVLAIYSDSSYAKVDPSDFTISPLNPTATMGDVNVSVYYQGSSSGIAIKVFNAASPLPALVAVNMTVEDKDFIVGQEFLPAVTAVYADSSWGTIYAGGYTLNPAKPTKSAADDLKVSASYTYNGVTKTGAVMINVKDAQTDMHTLVGITASAERKTWAKFEPFFVNVEATYSDGTKGVIEHGYALSPASPTAIPGIGKSVEVSYKGFSSAVSIDVNEEAGNTGVTLIGISATAAKYEWLKDELFSVQVTATYSDGASATIAKGYYTNPESPTAEVGEVIHVGIIYKNQTTTVDIKVVLTADMLSKLDHITAVPDKDYYRFNEAYSIKVSAFYGDSDVAHLVTNFTTNPVNITGSDIGVITVTVSYKESEEVRTYHFDIMVIAITVGSVDGGTQAIYNLTSYIDKPVLEGAPDVKGGSNPYFSVDKIEWVPAADAVKGVFRDDTVYTAVVTLSAKHGYTFDGINTNAFTHNHAQAGGVTNLVNTGNVTIQFPKTGPTPPDLTSLAVSIVNNTGSLILIANPTLTPAFSPSVKDYIYNVYSTGTISVKITATARMFSKIDSSFVSPKILDPMAPDGGSTKVSITVRGTIESATYTVTIRNGGVAIGGDEVYIDLLQAEDFAYYTQKRITHEIHKFKSGGTLKVNKAVDNVRVMVVAGGGGGGGGNYPAGGGGGGGYLETKTFSLKEGTYSVGVGAGGAGGRGSRDDNNGADGYNGGDSWFGVRSSYGIDANGMKARGGGGGGETHTTGGVIYGSNGHDGGSGGGSGYAGTWESQGGKGESGQGNEGGGVTKWVKNYAAGGGGATGRGVQSMAADGRAVVAYGTGKDGIWILGSDYGRFNIRFAFGGDISDNSSSGVRGNSGEPNTGNGGMGGWNSYGGNGGSGIVVVAIPLE